MVVQLYKVYDILVNWLTQWSTNSSMYAYTCFAKPSNSPYATLHVFISFRMNADIPSASLCVMVNQEKTFILHSIIWHVCPWLSLVA